MTSLATLAVHAGRSSDGDTGAILTPIHQVTTYEQGSIGVHKGYTYSRAANPTVAALESRLAALEGGVGAVAFSSGMAAIDAVFRTQLAAGDHVVVGDVVYGGTVRLLRTFYEKYGVGATFVDASSPAAAGAAIRPETKLVFVESPGNPTLKLADIAGAADAAHRRRIPLAVDNTFLTPLGQRVFDLGADISIHSTTKYIEGHNTTIGGAVVVREDQHLVEQLQLVRKSAGTNAAPFEAWLTLRGVKTLPLRIRAVSETAAEIARFLDGAPQIKVVHYPGLPGFPQKELACRQHIVHGGIVAFELAGGYDAALGFSRGLKWITLAENLGASETILTHPASMTHASLAPAERASLGITAGLLRLSVGLEAADDLIEDLAAALKRVERLPPRRQDGLEATPVG